MVNIHQRNNLSLSNGAERLILAVVSICVGTSIVSGSLIALTGHSIGRTEFTWLGIGVVIVGVATLCITVRFSRSKGKAISISKETSER